jgi:formate dehydrogenase/NADH-quinone oxidoreductase subunit F
VFDELRAIQREFGYLPADELHRLSLKLNLPISQIHAVASFYPTFNLAAPAKLDVRVCSDMTCHLRGAQELRAAIERAFQGAAENEISVCDASCLGRCDTAPAVSVNDTIYSGLRTEQVTEMLRAVSNGRPLPPVPRDHSRPVLGTDPYSGPSDYRGVRQLLETKDFLGTIAILKTTACAVWAGRAFRPGPNGRSFAMHQAARNILFAMPMRANRARSKTATSWSTYLTSSSRA